MTARTAKRRREEERENTYHSTTNKLKNGNSSSFATLESGANVSTNNMSNGAANGLTNFITNTNNNNNFVSHFSNIKGGNPFFIKPANSNYINDYKPPPILTTRRTSKKTKIENDSNVEKTAIHKQQQTGGGLPTPPPSARICTNEGQDPFLEEEGIRSVSPSPSPKATFSDNKNDAVDSYEEEEEENLEEEEEEEEEETNEDLLHEQKPEWDDKEGFYIMNMGEYLTSRYEMIRMLGQGTFGKVVECIDKESVGGNSRVAIKVIRAIPKYRDAAKVELKVLFKLKKFDDQNAKSNCIHLLDCFDYRNHICLVFPLLSISLFDFLKNNKFQPFPIYHCQDFGRQLLTACKYLHDLALIHTDLKPENILLRNSDFDLIRIPKTNSQHSSPSNQSSPTITYEKSNNKKLPRPPNTATERSIIMTRNQLKKSKSSTTTNNDHNNSIPASSFLSNTNSDTAITSPAKKSHGNNNAESASTIPVDEEKSYKKLLDTKIILIDFGSATFEDSHHASVVSTRHYRAPEIILDLGWSYPCDIWSIGCILVELITGEALFQTHKDEEHLKMMEINLGKGWSSILGTKIYNNNDERDFARGEEDYYCSSSVSEDFYSCQNELSSTQINALSFEETENENKETNNNIGQNSSVEDRKGILSERRSKINNENANLLLQNGKIKDQKKLTSENAFSVLHWSKWCKPSLQPATEDEEVAEAAFERFFKKNGQIKWPLI